MCKLDSAGSNAIISNDECPRSGPQSAALAVQPSGAMDGSAMVLTRQVVEAILTLKAAAKASACAGPAAE
ncbi:MAG: hypothetical protein VX447_05675 [Pseudomonadota bacterium]|nr:hypothetical protein [Gallaecimonas pentaromativorans]MED5524230.1 hypothetical protein [Pseudomonadota bacterium]